MRKRPFILILLYSFFLLYGRVFGVGEKIITLGSESSWDLVEKRQGIIEVSRIRPYPVLVLDQAAIQMDRSGENYLDLALSFDEESPRNYSDLTGSYDLSITPALSASGSSRSRLGAGAAVFSGEEALVLRPRRSALFSPGSRPRDFSIEFWLYPQDVENGGQVLSFTASKGNASKGDGGFIYQSIQCVVSRNRLNWIFGDMFFSPGEGQKKSIALSGPALLPRRWSHHLIRFDADLGLLEYLVDGRLEALDYATSTGREGGEVFTPVIGDDCRLSLGGRFSGMMDEFRIYSAYIDSPQLAKYRQRGGRAETRTMDLGYSGSRLLKIEAFGGRTSALRNEYAGNASLSFQDYSELRLFVRMSNSPYNWNDVPWIPFRSGSSLPDTFCGRYIQIGMDFYPGEDGETTPYLSELKITYNAAEPPSPPARVSAVPKNGAVELSWNPGPSKDTGGYLVYFGTSRGEYFGDNGIIVSPVDAGKRTSIRIDGLNNGTLYYFTVAAYNITPGINLKEPGAFSREIAARPQLLSAEDG